MTSEIHSQIQAEVPATPGVSIDPFGAKPQWASRLTGLGGPEDCGHPGYIFRTAPVSLALGRGEVTVKFENLQAGHGHIDFQLLVLSAYPGAGAQVMRRERVDLSELATRGGGIRIEVVGRRNMLYAVAADLVEGGEAAASAILVTLDGLDRFETPKERPLRSAVGLARQEASGLPMLNTMRLLDLEPPIMAAPVCQGWTPEQEQERTFGDWSRILNPSGAPDPTLWRDIYLLQTLKSYGALRNGALGLGLGVVEGRLPACLAGLGCSILASGPHSANQDPGLVLEQLVRPDLCAIEPFFDRVDFTFLDMNDLPSGLAEFDFLWSVGFADALGSPKDFLLFVENAMRCLKPGGVAVHIFDRAPQVSERSGDRLAIGRSDIERMALSLISYGHEVAQLKFGRGSHQGAEATPFGLITRLR